MNYLRTKKNNPGMAQVGAISKAQKDSKTETTFSTTGDNKSSQKTKIEKKITDFFLELFLKFPVSLIVPKNVKGGTLWDFLNVHSVAKYQKLMGGTIKKIRKKFSLTLPNKGGKSHSVEKMDPSALEWLFISC